jgi:two-component system cell cycle response regulator DivK
MSDEPRGQRVEVQQARPRALAVEQQGKDLLYQVSDTGIGIPKEELENIFGEFQQVDTAITREFSGTDSGSTSPKSSSKCMVAGSGSKASWVQDRLFPLPFLCAWKQARPHERQDVLYVEDNEFNLKMVRQLLARTAYRLIEATDGELGVATALREIPDLILMDIQLPKLSGLDATRRLRADPKTAAIPIIVITSFALSGDDQKAKDAGATAYMAKPYSPRELLQMIRKLLPEQ